MNIGLLSIMHNKIWDFRPDMAQTYANALRNAIELQLDNDIEKQHGYFLSRKGYKDKDGRTVGAGFEDKLYVGNIHRIENHLYWNDEELQDDDQIIDVVVVDGPITRDGGGCSYGSKDWRDQVMYANTIDQVVGHLFIINTNGGEAEARNDYEMMIADCREKGKPTVSLIDGGCYSSGVNLSCRTDRVIVMNPHDGYGCIGTMAAFWAVAHDTVDQDGYRYVELVGKDCPEKNAWWREAAKGEYEKLQAELDRDTEEFHATVRENRPLVTDDMLSGKVFEAQEVIPALVDEIGDMERAIECIFALANEEMQAARFMTAPEPEEKPDEQPGQEPEELAKLNEQQKAAINKEKGNLTVVDDGHVTAERQGMFGPHMEEVATPKKDKEMTDEQKKAQEAAAAQAEEQEAEARAEGQEAGSQAAEEGTGEGAQEGAGEGSQEGAGEGAQEGAGEGTGEGTQEDPGEGGGDGAGEGEGEGDGDGPCDGAGEEAAAAEPSDKTTEEAQADIDKISETLRSAEQMIADKDREIAGLKNDAEGQKAQIGQLQADVEASRKSLEEANATIEANGKAIAEKDAEIQRLTKQVADLKAEVKELSGKEVPMVDAGAGIPEGNATGGAPKARQKRITRENMTYEHCREVARERRAEK